MFALAIAIGIYSYLIFSLGVSGLLYASWIALVTVLFLLAIFFVKKLRTEFAVFNKYRDCKQTLIAELRKNKLLKITATLLFFEIIVNFIGTLMPVTSFDSLWYHLTIPKIFLTDHFIHHISGGLLYYADMPKLSEMLYIPVLAFGNAIAANLIHFSFGLLCLAAIYIFSRKYLSVTFSFLVLLVFYSNLVVAWESTTAYVDLTWTFFSIMTLWGFTNFLERKERKWLVESAIMLGLAVATKFIAIWSLPFYIVVLLSNGFLKKHSLLNIVENIFFYCGTAFVIVLPWFVFSFLQTGNPFYPFFSAQYTDWYVISLTQFLQNTFITFVRADDPLSPVYLIFLPLILLYFRKFSYVLKIITIFGLFGFVTLYVTPHGTWGRYMLPYLPALSLIVVITLEKIKSRSLYKLLVLIIILISISTIAYRGIASIKYLPVLLGRESKSQFLTTHLNFNYGDFYDTDGYFQKNIQSKDTVLLYGFHNLYYVDFPFIDASWVRNGDEFDYIATQNAILPVRFRNWQPVYYNSQTHVMLYSLGGIPWVY